MSPFLVERQLLATDLKPSDITSTQLYLGDVAFDLSMLDEDEQSEE